MTPGTLNKSQYLKFKVQNRFGHLDYGKNKGLRVTGITLQIVIFSRFFGGLSKNRHRAEIRHRTPVTRKARL